MKKIIWALFDDGVGSWNNLDYDTNEFMIISFGIKKNNWEKEMINILKRTLKKWRIKTPNQHKRYGEKRDRDSKKIID